MLVNILYMDPMGYTLPETHVAKLSENSFPFGLEARPIADLQIDLILSMDICLPL